MTVPARAWSFGTLAVVAGFLATQVAIVLAADRGWFIDEGIYISAGLRTLDGEGWGDGFLSWLSGSLLWPFLVGAAWEVAGLEGARILSALCLTIGVLASAATARTLFGPRTQFWTAVGVGTAGPVIALGHLAVYDALAVGACAVALWCVVRLGRADNRAWLVPAAFAGLAAFLAKYPSALFAGPTLIAVLALLRGRKAVVDLLIVLFIVVPLPLALFIEQRGLFEVLFTSNVALSSEDFGVDRPMLTFAQVYLTAIPLTLALAGLALAARTRRTSVLLGAALVAPLIITFAYHQIAGNAVSDQKHVVFGLLLAGPLMGVTLEAATRSPLRLALAVPALVAVVAYSETQVRRFDSAWVDPRPTAAMLSRAAQPGDTFLINNSWPYILQLYADGRIRTPWVVYDVFRVQNGQAEAPLCSFDWFVDVPGGSDWPAEVWRAIESCGTFRRVFRSSGTATGLGEDLRFITYTDYATVWRNERR